MAGRIPVRLYVRIFTEVYDDLEDAPEFDSWEKISYINRPVGFDKDDGKHIIHLDWIYAFYCRVQVPF